MSALNLRFTTQAQLDVRRISGELVDLQRQVASGAAENDILGFGGSTSRLLSARSLRASDDARQSVIEQLQARFGVQGAALGQVAESSRLLAQAIRDAVSANDGRGIATDLQLSFNSTVSALNETWNGEPLFAGERQGAGSPVRVQNLDELADAVTPDALYNEADRHQVIDLGVGAPIVLAAKASELSQGLFDTLRNLHALLEGSGGDIGQPISNADRSSLLQFADQLEAHAEDFTNEEARAGQLQSRFEAEAARLQNRSNLLAKEISDQADADLAEVSIRLSSLLTQYEAAGKTFAELSRLSLLNYL
jgi:flagellin-like hook-associated protein FlgL